MPLKFDDLGSVGVFAKKLQKKFEGRDNQNEQGPHGQYPAYHQMPQQQDYSQSGQYTAQPGHYGYQQPPHHQYHQQHHFSQHAQSGYLSPHQPPHHGPHLQQTPHHQYPPRPLSSPPFATEPHRQMYNPTPQPYASSHGSASPQPPSIRPSPGHHGLPPGAHIDTKTGQIQTNMFPPDYDGPLLRR